MITSWYSQENRSSTMSAISGWLDRSIDSEHPVQSWNCSHTSTGFFALLTAATVCARYLSGNASVASIAVQNFTNCRRVTPRRAARRSDPFQR